MDPGGDTSTIENSASNQSTKQNPAGASVSTALPISTPPFTALMQQAVALQQYQFQQALMMQQAIAAQQATARAASVKSAAEMAAARAAEISKQLKGNDIEREKSPGGSKSRSKSKSISRSPSISRSKSRSRSPIRYRRGRSISRSPIRYRRDYYSPSRSRDYYGYRSRGYRGYYRGGRGDYAWNFYRRERERDYYFRNSRRSRSRGRRRSRTRSRSPRRGRRSRTLSRSPRRSRRSHTPTPKHRREKSVSPKHKREERRSYRSSRRSTSVEVKRSPSVSCGSLSSTPRRNEVRSSTSDVNENRSNILVKAGTPIKGKGKIVRKEASSGPSEGNSSPFNEERSDSVTRRSDDGIRPNRAELSSSPAGSPSTSVEYTQDQKVASFDDAVEQRALVQKHGGDGKFVSKKTECAAKEDRGKRSNTKQEAQIEVSRAKESSIVGKGFQYQLSNFEKGSSGEEEVSGGILAGVSKPLLDYESEGNEQLDDWRDDLRENTKKNGNATYGGRSFERSYETWVKKSEVLRTGTVQDGEHRKQSKQIISYTSSEEELLHGLDNEQKSIRGILGTRRSGSYSSGSEGRDVKDVGKDDSKSQLHRMNLEEDEDDNNKEGKKEDLEDIENEREVEEEVVFEGPRLASEDYKERVNVLGFATETGECGREAADTPRRRRKIEKKERKVPDHRSSDLSAESNSEEDDYSDREEIEHIVERDEERVRARSKSKESKRHENEVGKREKRKHRHRKHKRKHRYEDTDEEKDDVYDEKKDEGEGRKGRKRHKRRHKKDGDHEHKDRKRRKHKHKLRSPSESPVGSVLANVDGVKGDEDQHASRKKSSKRHKKPKRDLSGSPSISATSSD